MLDFQSIEKFIDHWVDFDQPTHDLGCREVGGWDELSSWEQEFVPSFIP